MSESSKSQASTNVQVAVRCRPLNTEERKAGTAAVVSCDIENKSVKVSYGPTEKKLIKSFAFDNVFGMYSQQEEVFNSMVLPIVEESLAGFNCTIFAYGQTGTGKTHTMEGNIHSKEDAGIVPRSIRAILEQLEGGGHEFTIRVSFLELYNEELQDLLNSSADKKLKLCEDAKKGVVCQNLEEVTVLNTKDILEILQRGIQQRQVAATLCNKNSSRSHTIFTMKIMIRETQVDGEEVVRHGQLNLVDLAGSECIGRSGAKNDRAREAGSINQSLLTLGRVITALVDHHNHIPYRDSKLTRILQDSLGGKAKTTIIATLSPAQAAQEETMSTLEYAFRARSIKNQPMVNQRMTKKVIMKEYFQEIEQLKVQLNLTREKNGVYLSPEEFYSMETRLGAQEQQLAECETALKLRTEEFKAAKATQDDLEEALSGVKTELSATKSTLVSTQQALELAETRLSETEANLRASEAVVRAQSHTEATLTTQAQDLQQHLTARQGDIDQLLAKIERMHAKEAERLSATSRFVTALNGQNDKLVGQVVSMAAQSKANAATLCDGVDQILQRGKSTCTELKSSIDQALSTLIGDASEARDGMAKSCSGLKQHLETTNIQLTSTLQTLQSQLSQWLQEADDSLQMAQSHLTTQSSQIDTVSQEIVQGTASLNTLCASYEKEQALLQTQARQQAESLKTDLMAHLSAYRQQTDVAIQEANFNLKSKAEALQVMLKELVSATSTAMEGTSAAAAAVCDSSESILADKLTTLNATHSNWNSTSTAHVQAVQSQCASMLTAHSTQVKAMEASRTGATETLQAITSTVGAKRKDLDDTVSTLVQEVGTAITEGCGVVDTTAETANTVLKNVQQATEKMTDSASASMDTFTTYLNQEGEAISTQLNEHFTGVKSHLDAQQGGMSEMKDRTTTHGTAIEEGALKAQGHTPKKRRFASLPALASTRDHEAIRRDAMSGTSTAAESDIHHPQNVETMIDEAIVIPEPVLLVDNSSKEAEDTADITAAVVDENTPDVAVPVGETVPETAEAMMTEESVQNDQPIEAQEPEGETDANDDTASSSASAVPVLTNSKKSTRTTSKLSLRKRTASADSTTSNSNDENNESATENVNPNTQIQEDSSANGEVDKSSSTTASSGMEKRTNSSKTLVGKSGIATASSRRSALSRTASTSSK